MLRTTALRRATVLLALTLSTLVGLAGCGLPERGDSEIRVYGDVAAAPLEDSLERIRRWLDQRAQPYADALQPGIDRAQVDAAIEGLGIELPDEVYRLYAWRNGQRDLDDDDAPLFFPGYRFLPIEDAADITRQMREILWAIPVAGRWQWPKNHFPIFELQEDLYVVVAKGGTTGEVLDWGLVDGPIVAHPSLASTVQEIADVYDAGGYVMSDSAELIRDELPEAEVFRRYHPSLRARRALEGEYLGAPEAQRLPGGQQLGVRRVPGGSMAQYRIDDRRGHLAALFLGERDGTDYDDAGRPLRREDTSRGSIRVDRVWTWHDAEHATLTVTYRAAGDLPAPTAPGPRRMRRDPQGTWSWLRDPGASGQAAND
ncbi:MAG: SMI1/KNR4 family protein [Acidobacteriota bacterium]